MTNFEYLKTLSLDELADFLCMIITDCRACSMKNKCNRLRMEGVRTMTRGQQIEYAIFKAVSEYSFVNWLEDWGISKEDWNKFMDTGIAVIDKDGEKHDD